MLKSVYFLPKFAFERISPKPDMLAISIGLDREEGVPGNLERFGASLRLSFDDLYEESLGVPCGFFPDLHPCHEDGARITWGKAELCDFNDALRVVRFVENFSRAASGYNLIVHCYAGVSRSAAVALFVAETYDVPIANQNPDTSFANARFCRLLNKANQGLKPAVFEPAIFNLCAPHSPSG